MQNNQNAQKRKPLTWPKDNEWRNKEELEQFCLYAVKEYARQNPHDTRSQGALNSTMHLYAELKGWIQKTPLNIIQANTVVKFNLEELKQKLDILSEDEQILLSRAIAKLEASTST